jgi:glycosyltransferase involved in cell wall biosynthesis
MRILLTADAVGGVWQYSTELLRGLSGLGVEIVLASLGPSPSKAQLAQASAISGVTVVDTGLPLDWMAETPMDVRAAGEAVAKLAAAHRVDLVQLNSPALAADTRFPVPVVAVAHSCIASWWSAVKGGEPDGEYRWRSDLAGRGYRAADLVVAPTLAFARATQAAHGLRATPEAVHNGRTPLKLPRVAPHDFAFTAGRLWDEGKNIATLDRAADRLAVPLYVAGPERGPNGASVALSHASPLGSLDETELARWLAARPVFVSAALYEPFGLAVLEAAAAGCPLVLSDIPTFRELWDGAATFVDPKDDRAFAGAMTAIVGDDALRAAMGAAARERARRYTPDATAARMSALYAGLTGSNAAGGARAAA